MRILGYLMFLSFLVVLLSCNAIKKGISTSPNEIVETKEINQDISIDASLKFPDDWLGFWEGNLSIYNERGLEQTLPMALDNSVTDVVGQYTWAIIYGTDSIAGRRDYMLIEEDRNKGHYTVDEKNGILLDAYLIDNELISIFEVMGNSLTSTYKRERDEMYFEIMMHKSQSISVTGDTIIGIDTIPAVKNYKPFVRQKAILKRRS